MSLPSPRFLIPLLVFGLSSCSHTPPFTDSDGRVIPGSVASMEMIELGGVEQSVWFRGVDIHKPALILLHGGPGASEAPLFRHYNSELEKHFLVVYWEQRGAGRSYHGDIPPESMTIEQFVSDLDELTELVRRRFHKQQVTLLAHSWGTIPGLIYAHDYPEKVAAYVGVAQIANFSEGERRSYEWALARAAEKGNQEALEELEAMAPAPDSVDDELLKGRWVENFGGVFHQPMSTWTLIRAALGTDEATLLDLVKFGRGNRFSLENLRPEYHAVDLTRYREFELPVIFILGRYDWHVPSVAAAEYFAQLQAPKKRLIWFEESAHNPPFEEPERFVNVLRGLPGWLPPR